MAGKLVNLLIFIIFFDSLLSVTIGIPLSENVMKLGKETYDGSVTGQTRTGHPPIVRSNTDGLSDVLFLTQEEYIPEKNIKYYDVKNNAYGRNVEQRIIISSTKSLFPEIARRKRSSIFRTDESYTDSAVATDGNENTAAAAAAAEADYRENGSGGGTAAAAAVAATLGIHGVPSNNVLNTGPATNTGANANGVNGVANTNGGFGTNTGVGLNTLSVLNIDDRYKKNANKNGLNINVSPVVAVNGEGKLATSSSSVASGSLGGLGVEKTTSAVALNLQDYRDSSLKNAKRAKLFYEIEREVKENNSDHHKENILNETKANHKDSHNKSDDVKDGQEYLRPYNDRYNEEYDPYYYETRDDSFDSRRSLYERRLEEKEVDRLAQLLDSIRNMKYLSS